MGQYRINACARACNRAIDAFTRQKQRASHIAGLAERAQGGAQGVRVLETGEMI